MSWAQNQIVAEQVFDVDVWLKYLLSPPIVLLRPVIDWKGCGLVLLACQSAYFISRNYLICGLNWLTNEFWLLFANVWSPVLEQVKVHGRFSHFNATIIVCNSTGLLHERCSTDWLFSLWNVPHVSKSDTVCGRSRDSVHLKYLRHDRRLVTALPRCCARLLPFLV